MSADWTQHDERLGKLPDAQLATELGVNRSTVKRRREKLGISAYTANGDGSLAWVSVDSLRRWDKNPRIHGERAIAGIVASIKRLGHGAPFVVANGEISAGHGREEAVRHLIDEWQALSKADQRRHLKQAKAWRDAGRPDDDTRPEWHPQAIRIATKREVVVWARDDWSERDAHLYGGTDNQSATHSTWDQDLLPDFLADYEPPDLHVMGFNDIELADLLTPSDQTGEVTQDEVPDPPEDPVTKPGDVWLLGGHRLVCGDSTEPSAWAALCGDEIAAALITDPPYGVAYQANESEESLRARNRRTDGLVVANDAMTPEQLETFLTAALTTSLGHVGPGSPYYIFGPPSADMSKVFLASLEASGWLLKHGLVWIKDVFVFGRTDYHYQHETIWYGWKKGAAHYFGGDRTGSSVLEFSRPRTSEEHPTMKPVELVAHLLERAAPKGATVLDPFAGSGTTLICCEQLGRVARCIELEPRYCDVIVERWQNLTGEKATRKNSEIAV